MSCAIGDDENMPPTIRRLETSKDWMKGWEEGALHACERIAFVGLEEAQREIAAILTVHREGAPGQRRPRRKSS